MYDLPGEGGTQRQDLYEKPPKRQSGRLFNARNLKNINVNGIIGVAIKRRKSTMDAQKPEYQDVAAPALVVDENDEIVGFEAEPKEGE